MFLEKLEKIDFWLIGKFEKFSHKFQWLTGKNCFWLAKFCLNISLALFLLCVAWGMIYKNYSMLLLLILCCTLYPLLKDVPDIEKEITELQENRYSNPAKVCPFMRLARISIFGAIFAFLPLLNIFRFTDNSFFFRFAINSAFIMMPLGIYFLSCDPLPPAKSKVREWLEKAAGAVKKFFAPVPAPQPVPVRAN